MTCALFKLDFEKKLIFFKKPEFWKKNNLSFEKKPELWKHLSFFFKKSEFKKNLSFEKIWVFKKN